MGKKNWKLRIEVSTKISSQHAWGGIDQWEGQNIFFDGQTGALVGLTGKEGSIRGVAVQAALTTQSR